MNWNFILNILVKVTVQQQNVNFAKGCNIKKGTNDKYYSGTTHVGGWGVAVIMQCLVSKEDKCTCIVVNK